jgi:hypothetical protein
MKSGLLAMLVILGGLVSGCVVAQKTPVDSVPPTPPPSAPAAHADRADAGSPAALPER